MPAPKLTFHAKGDEIFIKRGSEPSERTLKVVGGSVFRAGLAKEIADVMNKHYETR